MKSSTLQTAIIAVVLIMASITTIFAGCYYIYAGCVPIIDRLLIVTSILGGVVFLLTLVDTKEDSDDA